MSTVLEVLLAAGGRVPGGLSALDTGPSIPVPAYDCRAVFFTGDHLLVTNRISDARIRDRIRDIFKRGGMIVGTSAELRR